MSGLKLEELLISITDLKNELHNLEYGRIEYDEKENQLHVLEDLLITNFGDSLTDTLQSIHNKYCIEKQVLTPIAYIGRNYIKRVDNTYDVEAGQGVLVDVNQNTGMPCYIVIVPGPLRILMVKGDNSRKELWVAPSD